MQDKFRLFRRPNGMFYTEAQNKWKVLNQQIDRLNIQLKGAKDDAEVQKLVGSLETAPLQPRRPEIRKSSEFPCRWSAEKMKAFLLYLITALAEILGCYAVFLWLRHDKTALWAVVTAAGLGLFAWLLTLHPMANAGAGIRRLWGSLYRSFPLLAVARGGTATGSLGFDRYGALSRRSGSHLLRT